MNALIRLTCACLACLAIAACGGSGGSGGSDRQQITNLYSSVFAAMAHGDYAKACSYFTAREQAKVVAGAQRAGLKASSCAETFTVLAKQAGVTRAQLAQTFGAGHTGKVHSISIHGNNATITFTDSSGGQTYTETDALVRQDGKWKADRIIRRSPSS